MRLNRYKKWNLLVGIIGLLAVLSSSVWAEVTIKDIQLGELLMGKAVTHEDFKERVVAVEFWGLRCPPCRASIPHLVKWYEELGPKRLILIGFHVQNVPKDEVISFCKSQKVNYPIFQGGQIKGINVRGIPRFCIFDHRGKLVFEGNPRAAEETLKEVVENTPDPLVGDGPYKKLRLFVNKILKHKDLGKIMLQLKEKTETSNDPIEKEEAKDLLGRLTGYAQDIKARAKKLKEQEPLQSYDLYQQLVKEFKGCEFGDEAARVLDELKKDKEFQKSLKANKKFIGIQVLVDKFKPCQSNKPLDIKNCQKCRKKNQKLLNQITVYGKHLIKQYPETPAAEKVRKLFAELGIGLKPLTKR